MKSFYFLLFLAFFLVFASFHPAGHYDFTVTKIVIDAGHGGIDPGTKGIYSKEKDVALQVALKVGEYLEKYIKGVKVIHTRKDDTFISLKKRTEIANKHKADLFISIHANSLPKTTPISRKKRIKGVEVYVMGSQNTERAIQVAKTENASIFLESDYKNKYKNYQGNSGENIDILANLMRLSQQESSLLLAKLINQELTIRAKRSSYGVKQSNLYVMWSSSMPSALVEIGYLSNPSEEKELNDPRVQSYIASGIYRAIKEYKLKFEAKNSRN